jgi:hypothetical protein
MGHQERVEFFGHHDRYLAIPAFLPAVAFGVINYIALRDRRSPNTSNPPLSVRYHRIAPR